ncbi:DUF6247 family protein [Streptomyces olivaceoviridis]
MSAQPDHAPVTPYAPEPGAPVELLARLRADARAAQWVPAFEREWAAALDESRRTLSDQHVVHETQTSPTPSARRPGGPRSQSRCQAEPSLEPHSRPRPGQPADQPVT